jgi:hypothetical protein
MGKAAVEAPKPVAPTPEPVAEPLPKPLDVTPIVVKPTQQKGKRR